MRKNPAKLIYCKKTVTSVIIHVFVTVTYKYLDKYSTHWMTQVYSKVSGVPRMKMHVPNLVTRCAYFPKAAFPILLCQTVLIDQLLRILIYCYKSNI